MSKFNQFIGLFSVFGILLIYLIVRLVKEHKLYAESSIKARFLSNFSSPYNKVVEVYLELLQHVSKTKAQDISQEETYVSLLKLGLGLSPEGDQSNYLLPSFWFSNKGSFMVFLVWLLLYWLNDWLHFI